MSDKNSKDRRTTKWQASSPPPAPRGGRSGNRTMLGMTNSEPENPSSRPPKARPGLSGRTPGQAEEPSTLTGVAPQQHPDSNVPDTLYVEPPSESFSGAQTRPQPAPRRPAPIAASASQSAPSSPYNANAPESWRSAARNVAKRSPRPPGPKSDSQHLRLKYDDASYDDYRGVPKSRLPVVVLAFLMLLAVAGGGAYCAQDHGGLVALAQRLQLALRAKLYGEQAPQEPAAGEAATGAAPATETSPNPEANAAPGAAAPGDTQPAAAAPAQPPAQATAPNAAPGAQPSAASPTAPTTASSDEASARALADPDAPAEAPPATAAKTPETPKPAPIEKAKADKPAPKPAVARPAVRPEPLRPVVRHEPVLKIRDLSSPPAPGAPPEPSDTPYIPAPSEPPAPDEPR